MHCGLDCVDNKYIITARWAPDSHAQSQPGETRTAAQQAWCWSVEGTAATAPHANPTPSDQVEQPEGPPRSTACADPEGMKDLHGLLLVLHLLERGYITHPSGGREGFTYMMIVCEIFDFSREVPSVGEGGNAPNRKFFLQCGYGIHLRYTVEKCEFCTSHARLHRSKQLFYG